MGNERVHRVKAKEVRGLGEGSEGYFFWRAIVHGFDSTQLCFLASGRASTRDERRRELRRRGVRWFPTSSRQRSATGCEKEAGIRRTR